MLLLYFMPHFLLIKINYPEMTFFKILLNFLTETKPIMAWTLKSKENAKLPALINVKQYTEEKKKHK